MRSIPRFDSEIKWVEFKRELLRFVVSNFNLKDGKVDFTLKVPFNTVAKYAESENLAGAQRFEL